ncbi:putative glutamate/gamma-aminobutyrate antiporter [Trabulsiella guamensis ATCC 49490]|uniref:Putative glutamate/gamma-aminobutyrate antiporter n=1 Tax=Trabulsiella guamensis ATCC 49490 TaxID=1005994 RepID=A0A085AA54_9ENTR|nr:APC family permease [Trabulsiella guamensis]KFC07099.1 putative glutamate/gamma-aminobutyrate antiporter [Trabulsiella guamensis ATCC 49490]
MSNDKKSLSAFSLMMISVAAVLSVRNFPSMATYGWSSIGWYVLGTILFLLPMTLVSAELATGWNKGGGVYSWVREAFGEKAGFIAVFCEWSNNLVWFPTVLSFIAGTIAYIFSPDLANNGLFMFITMMAVFWLSTIVSLLGSDITSRINNIGVVLGSLVPSVLLAILGIAYALSDRHVVLPVFSLDATLPGIHLTTVPFVASVILMFAGMEMSGFHAMDVKNPHRDYPRAMFGAAVIVFLMSVFGTLAMSAVIPVKELNLTAGLMQAFESFLKSFGMSWATPLVAILVALGGFALLTTWLIGPILGLNVTAHSGDMPPFTRKLNKRGVPVFMLVFQGIIATMLSLLYVVLPSVNQAYWILSAITVLLLSITYMLLFAAAIILRIRQPDVPRAFRIPGGMVGMWIVAGLGFLSTAFAFIVGLLPPAGMALFPPSAGFHSTVASFLSGFMHKKIVSEVTAEMVAALPTAAYIAIMLFGTAVLALPPLLILKFRKQSWIEK